MARKHPQSVPTHGASPPRRGGGWVFSLILLAWWFGGYGLVAYGAVTDRGPFAFLIDWQTALFGGSNMIVGALIGAVIIFWGPPRLARLYRRMRPDNAFAIDLDQRMRTAMMSRGQTAALAADRWARMDDADRLAVLRRQRNVMFGVACVFLILTVGLATYVSVSADVDAGQPLTQLRVVADQPVSLGGKSAWVHVVGAAPLTDGVMARDYTIRGHAYRDYYTPLVPPGWHAGQRIYLVEKNVTIPGDHDADDQANPPGPIEGDLSTGGPRPSVAAFFRQSGFAVGNWTAVLERRQLNGTIPGEAEGLGWAIWFVGGIFTFICLLSAGLAQRRRRKLLRQPAGHRA